MVKRLRESRPGAVVVVECGDSDFDLLTVDVVPQQDAHDPVTVRPESDVDMFLRYLATQPGRSQVVAFPFEEDDLRLELLDSTEFCAS